VSHRGDGKDKLVAHMIHFNVTLDSTLLRHLRDGGWSGMKAVWLDLCRRHSVEEVDRFEDLFQFGQPPTADELSLLDDTVSFLVSNVRRSIEHVTRWMPNFPEDISQLLTVVFLPYGKHTFSPQHGLQFFSLDPYASPIESYLFLVHIYYHELSSLNDTPNGRQCSSEQLSAEDFKTRIRLLIRNEGIGNYAVLEDLIRLRDAGSDYVMRYFTYAAKIGDPVLLQGAITILADAFAAVDDENVTQFKCGMNRIFKNESLPIINLVGIHMAESIANYYDVATLKNVYQREAREFFALYGQTDAQFAKALRDI
jgi:hypothetical protein